MPQPSVARPDPSTVNETALQLLIVAQQLVQLEFSKRIDPTDGIRVDIPALGIAGGALMLAGESGNDALMLFQSAKGVVMQEAAQFLGEQFGDDGRDFGGSFIGMTLQRIGEVSAEMQRAAEARGVSIDASSWTVTVEPCDAQGWVQVVEERHLQIASACLNALVQALSESAPSARPTPFAVCAISEGGVEVTLTHPNAELAHLNASMRALAQAAQTQSPVTRVGRNDVCPCGSGKKFKKCCQGKAPRAPLSRGNPLALVDAQSLSELRGHELEARILPQLEAFAAREWHGEHCATDAWFADADAALQLAIPLRYFGHRIAGRTVAEHFLACAGARLSPVERRWLEAEIGTRVEIWEVVETTPEVHLTLRNEETAKTHKVLDKSASRSVRPREMILGRVLEQDGAAWLMGCHFRTLTPAAAEVVRELLRVAPCATDEARTEALVKAWEFAVKETQEALQRRKLKTSDGTPFLLVVDHFDLQPGKRADIEGRIRSLMWCQEPECEGRETAFPFVRPGRRETQWQETIYGTMFVSDERVRIQAHSEDRANILRSRIEGIAGPLLTHRLREHQDPTSSALDDGEQPARPGGPVPPEVLASVRAQAKRQLAVWLDEATPRLQGKTPRQAARTAEGKRAVEIMLRDMELTQARIDDRIVIDLSEVRATLGL